jgi:hypothetical protein
MNMTPFQSRQLSDIYRERRERTARFEATGATAEIGVLSNSPGTYTVNTLNGPVKRNFENRPFPGPLAAVSEYARQFGSGKLRRTATGTYLIFVTK